MAIDRDVPGSLFGAYQESLNHQTDFLFWQETKYKPNHRLNPADPRDRAMIPTWWRIRGRLDQSRSPKELIRARAVQRVLDMHLRDPHPIFVHTIGSGGPETAALSDGVEAEKYLRSRMNSISYAAIFNVHDPQWPQPMFETYPAGEVEIDTPPTNVSGEPARGHYGNNFLVKAWRTRGQTPAVLHYEGLTLRPLTADVVARLPDLDPVRHDVAISATGTGWIDFAGNRQAPRLIRDVYQPGDTFYYWDGPWAALAGSRGIAVVRRGIVVDTFQTVVS